MTTLRFTLAGALLGTMLVGAATAAERDPRGLGQAIAKRLVERRTQARTHATDFAGTDIGCIIMPRYELRPYGYPGHAMLCEADVSGEVLGAVMNKAGRQLCYITGVYAGDFCYDITICDFAETLCIVD
jgi:hypothetical protein